MDTAPSAARALFRASVSGFPRARDFTEEGPRLRLRPVTTVASDWVTGTDEGQPISLTLAVRVGDGPAFIIPVCRRGTGARGGQSLPAQPPSAPGAGSWVPPASAAGKGARAGRLRQGGCAAPPPPPPVISV